MNPSWIESANSSDCDFSLNNLPYCLYRNQRLELQIGVAIGDQILNLSLLAQQIAIPCSRSLQQSQLNSLMAEEPQQLAVLRSELIRLLEDRPSRLRDNPELVANAMDPVSSVTFHLPMEVGDYTDFYASMFHATNVGAMFRPEEPLLPNYRNLPVGYHGRSSSLMISGTDIKRPHGQVTPKAPNQFPEFQPTACLDYELELGIVIGQGNQPGVAIPIHQANEHVFGFCLLNDWSARDLQKWEYQPLGPFLAKSFATSISPFIVTREALEPFRCAAFPRNDEDPPLLDYLSDESERHRGGFDIQLEVLLTTEKMREEGLDPYKVSSGNFRDMYWTVSQLVTHHTSNGCNLRSGDLLGSGTVSGYEKTSRGCLLERNWDGEYGDPVSGSQRTPLELPSGERRDFLENGDEVTFTAFCEKEGMARLGFGSCVGRIQS
ncbi:MAG: fumarylacetoacetase [Planctomycetota bacterium]|nr:fumarylacetoacetase [Planctomycetota bacterium]